MDSDSQTQTFPTLTLRAVSSSECRTASMPSDGLRLHAYLRDLERLRDGESFFDGMGRIAREARGG